MVAMKDIVKKEKLKKLVRESIYKPRESAPNLEAPVSSVATFKNDFVRSSLQSLNIIPTLNDKK